jgi:hypothetical protein
MKYTDAAKYLPLIKAMAEGRIIQINSGADGKEDWVTLENEVEFTCAPELYRSRPAYQVGVEKAYKEGKKIQFRNPDSDRWADCIDAPLWEWHNREYRVKPEPRTRYAVEIPEKNFVWGFYTTLASAQIGLDVARGYQKQYQIVEYREVLK